LLLSCDKEGKAGVEQRFGDQKLVKPGTAVLNNKGLSEGGRTYF